MARLATVVKEVRAERKARGIPSLLLDGGDFMMGTGFALLRGKAELGIMDALNYDAINMGNHEFDWKPSGTYEIYSHIPQMGLDLPVVASNLIFDDEKAEDDALKGLFDQGVIKKYYIKNLSNGLKVGFFGITGKDAVDVAPFAWP
ncbi:MAG: bifunctional metallophosphatase/5'-nucleotidase, partial [Thermodesulfobacteriota bacterium]|nr:bifunctional metallophosphatase/5'-nucleotidase [Thermodesulfobacteriota bacterium]